MSVSAAQSLALAVGVGAAISLLSSRLRFPAVLPLLAAGLALGPSGLGLIETTELGGGLRAMVAVCIGLLVFEGGLHLDRTALGRSPRAVRGLVTIGAFVTWAGAAAAAHYAANIAWPIAVVLGAVFIVTGPTVIQPILRRVRLSPRLHSALSAEAILNDPIGVIATVTSLEIMTVYLTGGLRFDAGEQWWGIAWDFLRPMLGGLVVGAASGFLAWAIIRAFVGRGSSVPSAQLNLFALAACMIAFGAGEAVAHEAGMVAAIVCSIVMANTRFPGTRHLHEFKETLATIFVGMLFVLLASGFDVAKLRSVTWHDWAFVGSLLLLVRPVCVFLSAWGSALSVREKLYACFMQPRGIVAVSVAVIVSRHFAELAVHPTADIQNPEALARDAERVEVLTFMVVGVTVLLAGTFALPVARWFGVSAGTPPGVIIIGAHKLGRDLGEALGRAGVPVLLVDTNAERLGLADRKLVKTLTADATEAGELDEEISPSEYGWCYVWTGNAVVDRIAARWASERLGPQSVRYWPAPEQTGPSAAGRAIPSPNRRGLLRTIRELDEGRATIELTTAKQALAENGEGAPLPPPPVSGMLTLARLHSGRMVDLDSKESPDEDRVELVQRSVTGRSDWSERNA